MEKSRGVYTAFHFHKFVEQKEPRSYNRHLKEVYLQKNKID